MNLNATTNSEVLEYIKSLSVLVVEDEEVMRSYYSILFENMFAKVTLASNAEEGYNKFMTDKIDVIITDYNMPAMNGLQMTAKIRNLNKEIPIILVSAIEEIDVVVEALRLNVNNFLKKPITKERLTQVILNAAKLLIANDYLKEQRNKKIQDFTIKEKYNKYQEDLAFDKELNILRNDFYYQMMNIAEDSATILDFYYHPLDTLSGDAYAARKIDEFRTFYLIVDGMGKGLSASLTAMIMTSFANHIIDKMIEHGHFDLHLLVFETLHYIKKILLEEEALAIDYIVIDTEDSTLNYAKFAMPASLMQNSVGEVIRVKSNNPPMSKHASDFKISRYDISDIDKFLFYSDGVVENETIYENKPYADFIEEDFKNSLTKREFKESLLEKLTVQEDDLTLAFINKIHFTDETCVETRLFDAKLEEVDKANDWYTGVLSKISSNEESVNGAGVAFSELFMNAYEHGSLGISSEQKHQLLDEDLYFDRLLEDEKKCSKKITVHINLIQNDSYKYVVTRISDEGEGFDTQILSEIFRSSRAYNGRGVFVSRKNSMGIYYNCAGNTVLYLNKMR